MKDLQWLKYSLKISFLRFVFILFCLFIGQYSYAAVYYFSSTSGNDDYTFLQAQNPATPWKSLNRLNAYSKFIGSGDSVLFKRGDVFYGSIVINKSGSVFAPIYFGAYGHGNTPEINGLNTLKGWKKVKEGIYEAPCNTGGTMLTVNGMQQAMGRYPNKGYLTFESHSGNSSITDNQLATNINWTGAEVVIRKNRWIIDRNTITGQNGGTISYTTGSTNLPTNGYGYFIQNSPKTLDQFGEWYFDAQRKSMMVYFGNHNPDAYAVKTNVVNNLVDINRFNYITFENLSFTGAGNNTFNIIQSKKITIKNCEINLTGAEAIYANYTPFVTIQDCIISHALSSGITLDAGCTNSVILNNEIKSIGLIAGLGKSGSGTYEAITSFGDNTQIEKNKLDSIGYNGIYFGGTSSYAKSNYITYFCLTKDDGAGIYIGDWSLTMNKQVSGNIILHGVGNGAGTTYPSSLQAEGIYIDDNTQSVAIANNTVSLCSNNGIKIHNAKDIDIVNNLVYNNGVQLRMEQDHYLASSSYIRNNQIKNNTFFSNSDMQPAAKFSTHQDDIISFGQLDSNYYCRPNNALKAIVATTVKNGKGLNQAYNVSNWKSAYGKDKSSSEVPSEDVLFEYNASNSAKTVVLNKRYTDVHNKSYSGRITISPYSSVLLVASNPKYTKHVAPEVYASAVSAN